MRDLPPFSRMMNPLWWTLALSVVVMTSPLGLAQQGKPPHSRPTKPSKTSIAIVTDRSGKSYRVSGFAAKYWALGSWRQRGPTPTLVESRLYLTVETKEGAVTAEEELSIPFSSIRRIDLGTRGLNNHTAWYDFEIEMRDGSRVKGTLADVSGSTLERTDANGNKQVVTGVSIIPSPRMGVTIQETPFRVVEKVHLMRFVGNAQISTGKEGDFSMETSSVASIEFE